MVYHEYDEQLQNKLNILRKRSYSDSEEGWRLAEEVLEAGQQRKDDVLLGTALWSMASVSFMRGDHPAVVYDYAAQALAHAKEASDAEVLYQIYNLLGIEELYMNANSRAMDDFMNGLEYSEQLPDSKWSRGVLLSNIADVYRILKSYSKALEYIQKALPMLEANVRQPHWYHNVTSAYVLTGTLYLEAEKNIEKASDYCGRASKMIAGHDPETDSPLYRWCLLRARLARAAGRQEEESAALDEALDILDRLGIFMDSIDGIMEYMEYLISMEDVERFGRFAAIFRNMTDQITSGCYIRWLSALLQYERMTQQDRAVRETALEFYDAMQQQTREVQKTERQMVESRALLTRVRRDNRRLEKEAETDQLTGLPNRYRLNQYSDELFEKAWQNQTFLAVEILDIDFFKQYNDTFGHQAGDQCLKQIGAVLKRLADDDPHVFTARYGGDEFIVLYDNLTDDEVLERARRLRRDVQELHLAHPAAASGYVSISQGIRNSIPTSTNKLWDYMYTADNALYEVKKQHKGEIMLLRKAKISENSLADADIS